MTPLALVALLSAAPLLEEAGLLAVDGARLHYRLWHTRERTARPLLVYLHGGPGANGAVFRNAVGALLTRRVGDLLMIDQRGAGRSPTDGLAPADFTLPRFADDVASCVRQLRARHRELPRPILIGHSFGAAVAVVAARRHPGLASRLVLLSPALDYRDLRYQAYLAMKQRARHEGDRDRLEALSTLEASHPAGSPTESELFGAALTGRRFDFDARRFAAAEEEDLYRILAARDREPLRVGEHWKWFVQHDQLDRADLTTELPLLNLPVLVIGGQEDFLTPPGCLEKIRALTPGARLKLMPRAGHHPYLLAPEAFVEHLGGFAREH